MTISTVNWLWPQWALLIILALHISIHCAKNGEQIFKADKKTPLTYSAGGAFFRVAVYMFIMICGGFFR